MDSDNKELAKAIRELAKAHVEGMNKLSESLQTEPLPSDPVGLTRTPECRFVSKS